MFDHEVINSYLPDLKRYCISIAGTPWDGEDLYQDTLIKMLHHQTTLRNHSNPKGYLFKSATNQWRDMLRKNKHWKNVSSLEEEIASIDPHTVDLNLLETIEVLVTYLPLSQASIILLIDYFGFTAKEVSELLEITTGAVKATLHRGRKSIQKIKDTTVKQEKHDSMTTLIKRLLHSLQNNDFRTVISTYHLLVSRGIMVDKDDEWFYFELQDPDGNLLSIIEKINK
ncbi:RNA polymerase sigma factor [Chengkuizengella axinellae]|uniref:RNA polymerase sigma factor n=1 Tax=Chengkuizengella axinellae TaxID=3064388 RepID=A0ABT9IWX7_9BACL|nr:RNA polymerase sigma factor [Chengkuizengella sp. 2205SS18-9]MDP5273863.1 RNA polymerase sigma factor [Chengkuizengella sp. 2205SS18-9]